MNSLLIKNFLDLIKISNSTLKSLITKRNEDLLNHIMDHHKKSSLKVKKYIKHFHLMNLCISLIYIAIGISSIFYIKERIEIPFIFLGLLIITMVESFFIFFSKEVSLTTIKIFTFLQILILLLSMNTFIFLLHFYKYNGPLTKLITTQLITLSNLIVDLIYFEINKIYANTFFLIIKILELILIFPYLYDVEFEIIILLTSVNILIFLRALFYISKFDLLKKAKFILHIFINDIIVLFNSTLNQLGVIHILMKDNKIFYTNVDKENQEKFFLDLITNSNMNKNIFDEEIKKSESENKNVNNKNENLIKNNNTNKLDVESKFFLYFFNLVEIENCPKMLQKPKNFNYKKNISKYSLKGKKIFILILR